MENTITCGIAIGIPFHPTRPVQAEWAVAMMNLTLGMPILTAAGIIAVRGQGVPMTKAREQICDYALSVNARYLLMIDDDTAPPSKAVHNLIQTLSSEDDIAAAGGIYFTREEASQPLVARKRGGGPSWDWRVGDRFDVEGIGMGCFMMKTDILRLIPKPWFVIDNDDNGRETEDLYFVDKILKAGFRVVADARVICDHIDAQTGKKYGIPADSLLARKTE